MKKVDRNVLREFIDEKGYEETNELMKKLEPFYQIAERGCFELAPEEEIDEDELKKVLSIATKKKVKKIIFLSLSSPAPRPEWIVKEIYKKCIRDSLWFRLSGSFRDSFKYRIGDSFCVSLWDSLSNCLLDCLRDSLSDSFRDILGDNLWTSLEASLLYFIGLSIADNKEAAFQLEQLLQYWPKCFILGGEKDHPGIWFVLGTKRDNPGTWFVIVK